MRFNRAVAVALMLVFLCGLPAIHADTLYMDSGERMEGRILEIKENEEGLQSITIRMRGAIIEVPAAMIDHYEDVIEPTDTPTPTPSVTPTTTETPVPTVTFTPFPTSTPFVVVAPPTPVSRPAGPGGRQPDTVAEPGEDRVGEPDAGWGEDWGEEGTGEGAGGFSPTGFIDVYKQLEGPAQILSIIATILLIISWIICMVDAFNQSGGNGVMILIFGSPCCGCCFINYAVLLTYSFKNYTGDNKWVAGGPVLVSFLIQLAIIGLNIGAFMSAFSF